MTRSNDSLKVIVVGVPKTMDDSGLHDLFSAYGSVADAKIVKDAATDASRGFGFVTFTAQSAMRRAVKEMDKKQLEGRTLNVRQLVAKDQLQKKDPKSEDMAKRPCYLLRKGKCTKGDRCPYSHEIKSGEFGSCFEFVQNGSCKRGDNCKFFHPPPPSEEKENGENENENENEEDSEREFAPPAKKEGKSIDKKETKKQEVKEKNVAEKKTKTEKKGEDGKPRYCFAFQSGRCHRGKRCLFLHEKLVVPENEAPPAAEASTGKKRPGDFEVVTTEEPSKKRRRESDDEDSDDEQITTKVTKSKEKAQEKAKEKIKEKAKEAPGAKKADTKKEKPSKTKAEDEKSPKAEKPAVGTDGKPVHTGPKPICRHFLKGLCKRGHICFFRHEQPTDEELKDLLPLKGSKKKANDDDDDEEDDPTALQAVADHMASFMASFSSGKPFEPFVPSAATDGDITTQTEASVKTESKASPSRPSKRKASDASDSAPSQPVAKRPRAVKKEKIDMGAAFDGVDSDDDDAPNGSRRKKLTREEMKASREKLREQRRAKKASKKQARERLKTEGEIEFS